MKAKKIKVIINEQHELLPEQSRVLTELTDEYRKCDYYVETETIKVPSEGWTLDEMMEIYEYIIDDAVPFPRHTTVIFVSPVPFLLVKCVRHGGIVVKLFHNDKREKRELPNGKVISVVAKEGWKLV